MTAPQLFLTETRERFLKAVVAELAPERIRELYLFAPIKQGGVESGVAVIAAELPAKVEADGGDAAPIAEPLERVGAAGVAGAPTTEPLGSVESDGGDAAPIAGPLGRVAPDPGPPAPDPRYTVFTARYRHTLKGVDRGKWESSIVAEADAPLLSIETVVRGVQRRAGDAEPPDHMSGNELRAALRLDPATGDL